MGLGSQHPPWIAHKAGIGHLQVYREQVHLLPTLHRPAAGRPGPMQNAISFGKHVILVIWATCSKQKLTTSGSSTD
eukprot:3601302-Amphidinium_carterae.5